MAEFTDDCGAVLHIAKGQTICCFHGPTKVDGMFIIRPVLNTDDPADLSDDIELVYKSEERAQDAMDEMFALTGSCLCANCAARGEPR